MRDGVSDTRRRVPFGNLEQSSGLLREHQCKRDVGFALLRRLLHPTAERRALERQGTGRKRANIAGLAAKRTEVDNGPGPLSQ
jgi:hypothetical protein